MIQPGDIIFAIDSGTPLYSDYRCAWPAKFLKQNSTCLLIACVDLQNVEFFKILVLVGSRLYWSRKAWFTNEI